MNTPVHEMEIASLWAALAAEKETTAQLVRALREETESPTFMGEPVLPEPNAVQRHALRAGDCPPDSMVMLVSSISRLSAHRSKP
jgi:hypothetical protein